MPAVAPFDFPQPIAIMLRFRVSASVSQPAEDGCMADFPPRLGDLIDDHCPRCRLLLNHAIASMVKDQVVKVVCQTCYSEHAYQRGQGGKKKPHARATLFD